MRRVLLPFLLLLTAFESRAAVLERPISDARIGFASPSSPNSLIGAFNGERFLIAWTSVDRGGQALVLDDAGDAIDIAAGLPLKPLGVAWNGEVWIVASPDGWVRVDRDGVLLDSGVRPFAHQGTVSAIVWSGTSLIVASSFRQPTFESVLRIAAYDAQMRLKATRDVDTNPTGATHIASDGEAVLLVYSSGQASTLRALLFDLDGTPLRRTDLPFGILALGTSGNGRGYRIVKSKSSSGKLFTSYHLDHELARTESLDTYGSPAAATGAGRTLTWDGSAFVYFYGLRGVRITESGYASDDQLAVPIPGHNYPLYNDLSAVSGHGITVVFYVTTSEEYGGGQAYLNMRKGASLADIAASQEEKLEQGAFQQLTPVAASSATQSLVVWRERIVTPAASRFVLATRIDANGRVLDPQSLTLGNQSCAGATPSVASDGSGFLAAWYDNDGLMTAQVRADGTVAARTRVNFFRDAQCHGGAPKAISNGSGYLVLWTREQTYRDDVFAVRLSADGTPLDAVPLALGTTSALVDGTSDGRDYLLAWDGRYMRVSGSGIRLDPRIEANNGHSAGGQTTIAVWWNGATYSLFQQEQVSFATYRYRFVRVAANGTVAKTSDWLPAAASKARWGTGGSVCDGMSCTFVHGVFENGASALRELRVTDDDVQPSIAWGPSTLLAPVLPRLYDDPAAIIPFRVPGGRLHAAFTRYALAQPYAGISRVFVRSMDETRGRVVRH